MELRDLTALETGVDPIQHQRVEVRVETQRRVVTLHADHGTAAAAWHAFVPHAPDDEGLHSPYERPPYRREQLGVEAGEIVSESNILDDLGADSLDVVELVMALEDEFDIEVPDEAAESIRTIADVERYVIAHVN